MEKWTDRTELLLSTKKLEKLQASNVLIVGLGGVGAYAAEMIARAGIGKMTIIDDDVINLSNLNRQLLATHSAIGRPKTALMEERLKDINPDIELTTHHEFLRKERTLEILQSQKYDYVIDAIDTITPKLELIIYSLQEGLNIISSMGAGGKRDPEKIHLADISKTHNCRLAKMLRKQLHHQGIRKGIMTVFSSELQDKEAVSPSNEEQSKKSIVGTISYMPTIFGCMIASEVIRKLSEDNQDKM